VGKLLTRARGEHAFRVLKQLWGFTNLARAQTMFALANLYQLRRDTPRPSNGPYRDFSHRIIATSDSAVTCH
jgi:hypothetical protein